MYFSSIYFYVKDIIVECGNLRIYFRTCRKWDWHFSINLSKIFETDGMKKDLRIIFMGTPDFAVPSLEKLVENGYNIVAVITAPDKPAGRGMKLQASAVKQSAEKLEIPVLQPTNLKNSDFLEKLRSYNANLQIVIAFRMLPVVVWDMPEIGTFNLHASLLPQYRGAAPIHWAVINGEKETGVTTFFLKHEIDTGDLILQEPEQIHFQDTTGDVYGRLMQKGSDTVLRTVQLIENGDYELTPQNLSKPSKHAPKIFKETCEIDFSQTSEQIYNFVRGLSPFPVAWTELEGNRFKIHKVSLVEIPLDGTPLGETNLVTDNKTYLHLKTADGYLSIEELQIHGKRRMKITDFLKGNNFGVSES
jgi:methionyl-tRNA formyltransferase